MSDHQLPVDETAQSLITYKDWSPFAWSIGEHPKRLEIRIGDVGYRVKKGDDVVYEGMNAVLAVEAYNEAYSA